MQYYPGDDVSISLEVTEKIDFENDYAIKVDPDIFTIFYNGELIPVNKLGIYIKADAIQTQYDKWIPIEEAELEYGKQYYVAVEDSNMNQINTVISDYIAEFDFINIDLDEDQRIVAVIEAPPTYVKIVKPDRSCFSCEFCSPFIEGNTPKRVCTEHRTINPKPFVDNNIKCKDL